jgi:membrane protein required for colicin V production
LEAISAVDVATLAILAVAVLRGLLIGLIREVFSLAALAAAWMLLNLPVEIGPLAARVAAGVVIAVAVIVIVATAGRVLRKGARWVGLGFADRLAGGVLGAAEGALVIVVLMLIGIAVVGRDHPTLAGSRALAAFESAERVARQTNPTLPPVALPPAES